jgi:hypothetical protein
MYRDDVNRLLNTLKVPCTMADREAIGLQAHRDALDLIDPAPGQTLLQIVTDSDRDGPVATATEATRVPEQLGSATRQSLENGPGVGRGGPASAIASLAPGRRRARAEWFLRRPGKYVVRVRES